MGVVFAALLVLFAGICIVLVVISFPRHFYVTHFKDILQFTDKTMQRRETGCDVALTLTMLLCKNLKTKEGDDEDECYLCKVNTQY